jgi:hypothetical protein
MSMCTTSTPIDKNLELKREWKEQYLAYLERKHNLSFAHNVLGLKTCPDSVGIKYRDLPGVIQVSGWCSICFKEFDKDKKAMPDDIIVCTVEWDEYEKCYRYDFYHDACNETSADKPIVLPPVVTKKKPTRTPIWYQAIGRRVRENDRPNYDMNDFSGKPWKCLKCGERFKKKSSLREHKRDIHAY